MTTLPTLPCPGSAGCVWYETAYEHHGIPYKYKSDTLTPIHSILRTKEGAAGRTTETLRFDRSLPVTFGVGKTVVARSPGWDAIWAARRMKAEAKARQEAAEAAEQIKGQAFRP